MNDALAATVARATGADPASIRIALRPPLEIQSNRLYDAWAGERHLIVKEFLNPGVVEGCRGRTSAPRTQSRIVAER